MCSVIVLIRVGYAGYCEICVLTYNIIISILAYSLGCYMVSFIYRRIQRTELRITYSEVCIKTY